MAAVVDHRPRVGVGLLGPAVDPLWLLIVAAVLVVAGGAFFYTNMQHT